ncbi:hypothetical protein [uncultured Clostridium sp.]|uniref:hypothetical protein n=1 Tax=uncultured Clostridium sp. TaxID=59620 RepID=UPI0028E3ED7F|nr:hypothetical protein [uncultured Clostridium sp.]
MAFNIIYSLFLYNAHNISLPHLLKSEVSIPVFAVYGINSPELAEEILNETNVDIARGTLINPNWANDAKSGKDTGKCLNCSKCMWFGHSGICAGKTLLEKNNK